VQSGSKTYDGMAISMGLRRQEEKCSSIMPHQTGSDAYSIIVDPRRSGCGACVGIGRARFASWVTAPALHPEHAP